MISVIIPVYNVESYLKRCLDSVINQSYQDLEIILIDDGSTDNSSKICDEYASNDPRVIVIHKQNAGQAAARNDGINIAKGEYIAFVDSDDWIELDMYETLLNTMISTNVDIVASGLNYVYLDKSVGSSDNTSNTQYFNQKEAFNSLFSASDSIRFEVWNKLFNRKVIGNIRFKEGQIHEEIYFIRKIFTNISKVSLISRNLYNYVVQREGNTNSTFKINRLSAFMELADLSCDLNNYGYKDIARQCDYFATSMAIGFYINASNKLVDKDILNCIYKEFKKLYINKKYLHTFRNTIFYKSPYMYLWMRRFIR